MNNGYFSSLYFTLALIQLFYTFVSFMVGKKLFNDPKKSLIMLIVSGLLFYSFAADRADPIDCSYNFHSLCKMACYQNNSCFNCYKEMMAEIFCNSPFLVNILIALMPMPLVLLNMGTLDNDK